MSMPREPGTSMPPAPGTSVPPPGTTMPPPPPATYVPAVIDPVDGAVPNYALGGVTDEGQLVTMYWNGAAEVLVLLDPTTAKETFVTALGSPYTWDNELTYDPNTRTAHATGFDRAHTYYLLSMSLDTKKVTATEIPVSDGGAPPHYVLVSTTADGRLVVAYWDGAAERAAFLDPKSGELTDRGTLSPSPTAHDQLAYDHHRNILYSNPEVGRIDQLYAVDLYTRTQTIYGFQGPRYDGGVPACVLGGVTSPGLLVAACWYGQGESGVLINRPGGEITPLGALGRLKASPYQVVMGGPRELLYELGQDQSGATRIYSLEAAPPVPL
jgi:hypothetical protein